MNTIGQVAEQLGVSSHTLRYYEKIGLLSPINKDAAGRRQFSKADIEQVKFIRRAQRMQFSLDEIRQLLNLEKLPAVPKQEAQALVQAKLNDIEESLQELKKLQSDLATMLQLCKTSSSDQECPIIDGMKDT